jgi:hypothetical protein
MVIDAVNLRQYIGAVTRISASIHLPLIGDAERMGLKLQKHSYCILNRRCAMSCATTIIEENIMFTHLKEYEKMLRVSNGKSAIYEERLYSFFFGFFNKKTKLRFFVFPLLHNY